MNTKQVKIEKQLTDSVGGLIGQFGSRVICRRKTGSQIQLLHILAGLNTKQVKVEKQFTDSVGGLIGQFGSRIRCRRKNGSQIQLLHL